MPNNTEYLGALEWAIALKHGCRAIHRKTDFVRLETWDEETVWEGYVETFELIGHAETNHCYVWQHVDISGNEKIFAVLGNNLIQSAEKAVQAAIFADVQPCSPRIDRTHGISQTAA